MCYPPTKKLKFPKVSEATWAKDFCAIIKTM